MSFPTAEAVRSIAKNTKYNLLKNTILEAAKRKLNKISYRNLTENEVNLLKDKGYKIERWGNCHFNIEW